MSAPEKMGRLAFRREGKWWVAYYAMPDTMKGALMLGSVRMTAAESNPKVKDGFISVMRELVGDILEAKFGVRPQCGGPQSAPEHERSGNA